MLVALHIENVATVKELDMEFSSGFTVLTGQTGAGKSVITDCVNLLTGDRSDRELVRHGEQVAKIDAVFANLSDHRIGKIRELGIECDGEIMLQRQITLSGKSTCRCNGKIIPTYLLKDIASGLLSVQSQNSSQRLLSSVNHRQYLDSFAKTEQLYLEYKCEYDKLLTLDSKLKELTKYGKEKQYRKEDVKKSIAEIEKAKLKPGEEEELTRTKENIKNIEALRKHTSLIYKSLYRSEKNPSASDKIKRSRDSIEALYAISPDEKLKEFSSGLEKMVMDLEEIAEYVRQMTGGIDEDPSAVLDGIEERLALIRKIKRRYGPDHDSVLATLDSLKKELLEIDGASDEIRQIQDEIKVCRKNAAEYAVKLSEKRCKAAPELKKLLEAEFQYLDLKSVVFDAGVVRGEKLTDAGIDKIEFLISTNPGEELHPLSKIASGGELARIMLAMNSVFADKDSVDTVIYDEADTGISGATSDRVGRRMRAASEHCQVISVTHAAQIASHAHTHILIHKQERDGRALTGVSYLDKAGRIREISRILGGVEITDAVILAATEMIENNS